MKIYTKAGDDGTTGLLGGDRVSKTSLRILAIGEVDELNATVGLARIHSDGDPLDEILSKIQNWLFDLGAELASPPGGKFDTPRIGQKHIEVLESLMDDHSEVLPPLKQFILPGGSDLGAHLHFARCVCRRAERAVLLLDEAEPVRPETKAFLNRLSDWFFVGARTANSLRNVNDIGWQQSGAL